MSRDSVLTPEMARPLTTRQTLFIRYLLAILIDLVVLNLFDQYSAKVEIDTFTTSLFAAILLQILLRLTLKLEHWVAGYFKAKQGRHWKYVRFVVAWLILFGSKFVILEAINTAFGESVKFYGAAHGVLTLILVLVVMVVAEEVVARIFRRLADKPDAQ